MTISPDNQRLLESLVQSGSFKSEDEAISQALRLLRDKSENDRVSDGDELLPPDEWIREFDRLTSSRTGGNPKMDDSRESIYGDRGS